MHVSAICCLSNHGFGIELFHNSRSFALFLNSINDYPIYHLLPEKQSPLSCLTSRTSGQKNGARPQFENGARPQFEPANLKMVPGPNLSLSPFSPEWKKHNKIAPFPLKVKREYQITSFLGYMYEYFTFVAHRGQGKAL
jgi:hypothetical protein